MFIVDNCFKKLSVTIFMISGCSTLHVASQFGHTSIVAYLIAKGMDIDMPDKNGMTALMWAAYRVFGSVTHSRHVVISSLDIEDHR